MTMNIWSDAALHHTQWTMNSDNSEKYRNENCLEIVSFIFFNCIFVLHFWWPVCAEDDSLLSSDIAVDADTATNESSYESLENAETIPFEAEVIQRIYNN